MEKQQTLKKKPYVYFRPVENTLNYFSSFCSTLYYFELLRKDDSHNENKYVLKERTL